MMGLGGDAVVVGGGLIGLGVAHELAGRGASVTVVDTGEPGASASWAGAGLLAPDSETMPSAELRALCRDSLARYPDYVAGLKEETGVDARLRVDGIVRLAPTAAESERLKAQGEALRGEGVPNGWLSRAQTLAAEPAVAGSIRGALVVEREGHVDNRRLGRALRAACGRRGVRFATHQRSVALETDDRRVRGVRTDDGFIAARSVVNAAGAWAGAVEGVPAAGRIAVFPVKGQMLALAMPRGLVRHDVWYPGGYATPRDDGRLLIGATVEDAGFDVRVTAQGLHDLLAAALAVLPALRGLTVSESWAGVRPATPDGLPFLGATEVEGYFVASGHFRNGILLTPATAQAVADAIAGVARPDLAPFRAGRTASPAERLA
jgi:glycine oxidase